MEQFDWLGKKIYPFVTHEGSGFGKSERDLAKVCKGANIQKGLAVQGSMAEGAKVMVERWIADRN